MAPDAASRPSAALAFLQDRNSPGFTSGSSRSETIVLAGIFSTCKERSNTNELREMRSPPIEADIGLMATKEETTLTNKQIGDLFKIAEDDRDACESAKIFFKTVTETIDAVSQQYECGAWTRKLDWPAVFRKCKQRGSFEVTGPAGFVVRFFGAQWQFKDKECVPTPDYEVEDLDDQQAYNDEIRYRQCWWLH